MNGNSFSPEWKDPQNVDRCRKVYMQLYTRILFAGRNKEERFCLRLSRAIGDLSAFPRHVAMDTALQRGLSPGVGEKCENYALARGARPAGVGQSPHRFILLQSFVVLSQSCFLLSPARTAPKTLMAQAAYTFCSELLNPEERWCVRRLYQPPALVRRRCGRASLPLCPNISGPKSSTEARV